ncbi:MAG: hypothetical protein JNL60_11555 [Bacteroidia bacterium]|nr:hypothetical protein [Bacteroidia bacterium]
MDIKKKYARLIYGGKTIRVMEAVKRANEILSDPDFYIQIRGIKQFDYTLLSSSYIAKILEECSMEIHVELTGLLSSRESRADSASHITINRWKFNTSLANRVNLLIHYTVEAVAHVNKNLRQEQPEKYKLAPPRAIGNIAGIMVVSKENHTIGI